jgi:uncharacterized membrane protein YhfC
MPPFLLLNYANDVIVESVIFMGISLLFMFISAGICLLVPTVIAVILAVKRKGSILMFILGAATFASTQLMLRLPLISELQNAAWFNMFMITQSFLFMMLLALSAGIFEETGRYVALRLINKDLLTWENGILFGLGHGGIEAFWLGMPYVIAFIETISGKNTAAVLAMPPADLLLGSAERILAITMHIGFSMLILYAVKRRKIWCFILAVFAHGLVDATSTLIALSSLKLGSWEIEGVFAVFAILAVVLTIKIKPVINSDKNVKAEITQAKEG